MTKGQTKCNVRNKSRGFVEEAFSDFLIFITRMGWLIESQFSKVPLYTLFVTTTPPVTSPLIHIKGKKTIKDSFKDRFTSCFNFCPTVLNENICYIMVGQINL